MGDGDIVLGALLKSGDSLVQSRERQRVGLCCASKTIGNGMGSGDGGSGCMGDIVGYVGTDMTRSRSSCCCRCTGREWERAQNGGRFQDYRGELWHNFVRELLKSVFSFTLISMRHVRIRFFLVIDFHIFFLLLTCCESDREACILVFQDNEGEMLFFQRLRQVAPSGVFWGEWG